MSDAHLAETYFDKTTQNPVQCGPPRFSAQSFRPCTIVHTALLPHTLLRPFRIPPTFLNHSEVYSGGIEPGGSSYRPLTQEENEVQMQCRAPHTCRYLLCREGHGCVQGFASTGGWGVG